MICDQDGEDQPEKSTQFSQGDRDRNNSGGSNAYDTI